MSIGFVSLGNLVVRGDICINISPDEVIVELEDPNEIYGYLEEYDEIIGELDDEQI
jgi:hypothetical protein